MVTLQQAHDTNSVNGETTYYTMCEAKFLADTICDFNATFESEEHFAELHNKSNNIEEKAQLGQQHMLEKGLKKYKEKGVNAVLKEIGQLHDRECFDPINIEDLTEKEKQQAQIALTYLTEKRDKTIKARTVYNGKPTREWLSCEELASPTASIEGIFLTAMTDA